MRFYQYWNGFIWEFNSLGEYLLAVLGRLIGAVIGFIILSAYAVSFTIMVKENGPILLNFGIS